MALQTPRTGGSQAASLQEIALAIEHRNRKICSYNGTVSESWECQFWAQYCASGTTSSHEEDRKYYDNKFAMKKSFTFIQEANDGGLEPPKDWEYIGWLTDKSFQVFHARGDGNSYIQYNRSYGFVNGVLYEIHVLYRGTTANIIELSDLKRATESMNLPEICTTFFYARLVAQQGLRRLWGCANATDATLAADQILKTFVDEGIARKALKESGGVGENRECAEEIYLLEAQVRFLRDSVEESAIYVNDLQERVEAIQEWNMARLDVHFTHMLNELQSRHPVHRKRKAK